MLKTSKSSRRYDGVNIMRLIPSSCKTHQLYLQALKKRFVGGRSNYIEITHYFIIKFFHIRALNTPMVANT